ncbi:MAG: tripartite tricarboxylate transporter substrate binding protein [Deltaproteobacteria bacterium]|jgi:tripartite-type tricarboxylate transporter receptor subunit TctC|nr:tripartite tricarboxylate transporter substrate binding protein [Deltaproteobacteria bacterium]
MKKFCLFVVSALVLFSAAPLWAADYPDKPVNMIIAFTAGGSSDVQARIMQKYWNKHVNQQWVFVYKPGAGGAIGFGEVAMAKPDGYTIGGTNLPHLIIQPLAQSAQFSIEDFAYICQVVTDPQAVVVRKDSPFKKVQDVFDFAKANPGKLKVGLVGPNSGHHLMFLDVTSKYDYFKVAEVFYKGAADQNVALLGGEIDVMFGNLNDVMRSLEEMRVLALAGEKRNEFLPDAPTMREQGFDIVSDIRRGFVAPKKIDQKQLDYLREVFRKICMDPDYQKEMKTAGQPHDYMDGEALYAYVKTQNEIVKAALLKAGAIKK